MALRAALQELTQNLIEATGKLDADGMIAPRLPDCIHVLHPKSTGFPPMDNTACVCSSFAAMLLHRFPYSLFNSFDH